MGKFFIKLFVCIILLGIIYYYKDDIVRIVYDNLNNTIKISELKPNKYYREANYEYVQTTNDFEANNYQELLNIYYTVVSSGVYDFTFKCDYDDCLNDVDYISNSQQILSNINSFVHPYNSFSSIETKYNTVGQVDIHVNKLYTEDDIAKIDEKIDIINKKYIKNETNNIKIIRTIHDYIINTTKYDSDRSDLKIVKYKSNIAYGPLIEGYGLCGGYTDAMALFLDYYNIPNFKVITENHVWNVVKINDKWYHLDLTWDDPVASSGKDVLEHTFFLITTKKLEGIEKQQHIYDKAVFKEVAN